MTFLAALVLITLLIDTLRAKPISQTAIER